MLSLHAFLGDVYWYARIRQGFCLFWALAILSVVVVLAFPYELGTYTARLVLAGSPALAFMLAFFLPLPKSFHAAALWSAGFVLILESSLAWIALPKGQEFFLPYVATGAGVAMVVGIVAGWSNYRMIQHSRPAEFSFFTAHSDPHTLAPVALLAAQACWIGWNPQHAQGLDSSKSTITFALHPGLTVEIVQDVDVDVDVDANSLASLYVSGPDLATTPTCTSQCLVSVIWRPSLNRTLPPYQPLSVVPTFRAAIATLLPDSYPESVD